jgi:hypothetical protein
VKLTWHGDKILDRVYRAQERGVNDTMDECASQAAAATPRRTGLAAGSIGIVMPAKREGNSTRGLWGGPALPSSPGYTESSRVRLFFLEVGYRGKAGLNMLRNTADREYPRLRGRIAAAFVRGAR